MSLFKKLSDVSRSRKIRLFFETFRPTEQTKILDVGAEVDPNGKRGLQFIDLHPWKNMLSAINLSAEHIAAIKQLYPKIDAKVGDACALPWPDKYFDVVYSNAVIEHVGDFDRQKQMAAEIMRVGKQWFVTTPNRWYPFEFHMRLPFVTWLPGDMYLRVGRIISYNHVSKKYVFGIKHDGLRLMTTRELKLCFPSSEIIRQRVTFKAETLIAIGRKP
jgi:SAM-dependent methyltransferase